MKWLVSLLACCAIGPTAAQVPVVTNVRASGAPAISGDIIAFPAATVVNNTVVHTLRYYSIATGITVDTGKELAPREWSGQASWSPSISGAVIAYVAPTANQNFARVRYLNVTTGQDVDTGQDVYLGFASGWSSRLVNISGDLIAYITFESRLAYYRISTGTATVTGLEAHGTPSISGNAIAYLNGNGCTIRHYNVASGVDTNVGHFNICDEAPAISSNVIAFTTGLNNPNTIVHHNIATATTTDIGTNGFSRSVSGNVIAFMGENLLRYHRIAQQSTVDTGLPLFTQPDVSNGVIAYAPFGDGSDPFNNYRIAYMRVESTDTTMPSIAINSPAATSYSLGQSVAAQYSCTDADTGIASCNGTVPNGQYIDTGTEGEKVFTVVASDGAGNSASRSVSYAVARKPPPGTVSSDLSVGMTHDAAKRGVTTGTAVNYTLVARNNGPDTATALQLRDDIPAGMSVEGASVGYNILSGGATGMQVVFDLGSLASGGTATVVLTMRVQAAAGATITNTASVAAATSDPKSANNVVSAIVKVR